MKALTVTAPYGTLIALGAKRIETRSWATRYRGPLAIHQAAGLGPVGGRRGLFDLVFDPPFRDVLTAYAGSWSMDDILAALPRGAIVAVARLVDCGAITDDGVRIAGGPSYPDTSERAFGDYTPGRFAWLLAEVRALPAPLPARGQLGLWNVPAEVVARIGSVL